MKKVDGYQVEKNVGILLNANESYANLDRDIVVAIQEAIGNIAFQRYPEDSNEKVRNAYASYIQKDPSQIIVGNGSDEMLGLLIGLQIKEGKKLYTLAPDFSMYDYYVSMHNGEVVKYDYSIQSKFDVDAFIKQGKEAKVDMVLFSNPNNPTGRCIAKEEIIKIVEAFSDIYVVVDEAYADFASDNMLDCIEKYSNLLVTRTLSKAFALASVRCGFLIGSTDTIAAITPYKVPYNVNTLSQEVASIVLGYADRIEERIAFSKKERNAFYALYQNADLKKITLYPSQTNYLYGTCSNIEKLNAIFHANQIIIRYYKDDSFRITIGSEEENAIVWKCLQQYEEEAA